MAAQFRLSADALARLGGAVLTVASALDCSVAEAVAWVEEAAGRVGPLAREAPDRYAARLLKVRSMRGELLGAAIFQDLAWDMLLDLYVREAEGRRVSVTSLTIASGGAPTTALRHLDKLLSRTGDAQRGYGRRSPQLDRADHRQPRRDHRVAGADAGGGVKGLNAPLARRA